jgi:hypothetical protein
VQLGRGRDDTGRITTDPRVAETSLAFDHLEAGDWVVDLPGMIVVEPGEVFWIDGDNVLVQDRDGSVRTHTGIGAWACR